MTDQLALFVPRRHAGQVLGIDVAEAPRAEQLHRADDPGGSIAAAARVVDTGRAAIESRVVLDALERYPGATSAELAIWAAQVGHYYLGQGPAEWRHTIARRLPALEDRGRVRAVGKRPSVSRPNRGVDPDIAPCTVSPGAPRSLRWWPVS